MRPEVTYIYPRKFPHRSCKCKYTGPYRWVTYILTYVFQAHISFGKKKKERKKKKHIQISSVTQRCVYPSGVTYH